jgi:hypothetical protein
MFMYLRRDGPESEIFGLAVVYYDNYLIATTDARVTEELHNRIIRNARHFNGSGARQKLIGAQYLRTLLKTQGIGFCQT